MTTMLKSRRFRMEREADWKRLEDLLNRFERGRGYSLSDDEVIAIPVLYRATLTSLSMARAISLDKSLVEYLESLSTRAYFCVYGARTTVSERIVRFFARDWPAAVRSLWRETIVSGAMTLLGAVTAYVLTMRSPHWFAAFVPDDYAKGRDPTSSYKQLADTLHLTHDVDGLTYFASFLFTHNAGVALLAFVLGFACCLPTAFLMIYQGFTIGALLEIFVQHGLGDRHDRLADDPRHHRDIRLHARWRSGLPYRLGARLSRRGQPAGCAGHRGAPRRGRDGRRRLMLAVAGLLEGYGRQLIQSTFLRYAIGTAALIFWCTYFYREREEP